jgi:hypothetical protein
MSSGRLNGFQTMKTTILLVVCAAGLSAQSLTVTSPANGSVVTTLFPLTVAPVSLPSMTQAKVYIDNRLECVINGLYLGKLSCPKMYNATFSDERVATIYAEAYDAKGTLLATSAKNTFRIDNSGLGLQDTFSDATHGTVTAGGTLTGSVTVTHVPNATVSGLSYTFNIDGVSAGAPAMFAPNATVDLVNGKFYVPIRYGHTGSYVSIGCSLADRTGCSTVYSPLVNLSYYDILDCGPNCVQLAAHGSTTPIAPLSGSVAAGSYLSFSLVNAPSYSVSGNSGIAIDPFTIDTTPFLDGPHRVETVINATPSGLTGTFALLASAINSGTGIATSVNFPLTQGQVATCGGSGTCPPAWTGTLYTVVESPDTFCFADSPAHALAGTCLAGSGGSGTLTISFSVPNGHWEPNAAWVGARTYVTEINEFTFSNGNVPCVLRTKYSKIVGIAGDTFTLAPYVLNCNSSTTSVSSSLPIYSTNDSSRATVSSSGVVTLGSTTGDAVISIVDNTHSREALVEVEVRPDRTTFKHLSAGSGIVNTYNSSTSKLGLVAFGGGWPQLNYAPSVAKYLRPAFTALPGYFPTTILDYYVTNAYGVNSFDSFMSTWWSQPASNIYSKAFALAQVANGSGMLFYTQAQFMCSGYNPYRLLQDAWRQQAMAQAFNDLYGVTLWHEYCDEFLTAGIGGMFAKPRGDLGSGQDSTGLTTIGGHPAGFTSIVTGTNIATINGNVFPAWSGGSNIQISGATSTYCKNLNGPYLASGFSNVVSGHDDPHWVYTSSMQVPTVGVPAGHTCDHNSDPGLVITASAGYQGVTGAAFPIRTLPDASGGLPGFVTWSGTMTSMVCASNLCTIHGTGLPFIDGQILELAGFNTSGLNGVWRMDRVDANTSTILVSSVADGTYNSSNNSGAQFYGSIPKPANFITNLFGSWADSLNGGGTGNRPPFGFSQTGGGPGAYPVAAGWNAPLAGVTEVIVNNQTFYGNDRYGELSQHLRDGWRGAPYIDGTLPSNDADVTKPEIYELPGNISCSKYTTTLFCYPDTPGADLWDGYVFMHHAQFISSIVPWILHNPVGTKMYQYNPMIGPTRDGPTACYPVHADVCFAFQSGLDEAEGYPPNWQALVNANQAIQKEDKCFLSPLMSSPDMNVGPGPYPQIEAQSHTGTWGSCMLVLNLSEEKRAVTIDLSLINPGGAGGPMRRWNLGAFGDTVTSLSPSTTSDTLTMAPATALLYVSQVTGSADDLRTINVTLTPAYGASKALLEIHYYLNDQTFQSVDCGSGACPPILVNLHNLDVYMRKRYTKIDGTSVVTGDLERLAAQ